MKILKFYIFLQLINIFFIMALSENDNTGMLLPGSFSNGIEPEKLEVFFF